jgi:predicted ester cyclase
MSSLPPDVEVIGKPQGIDAYIAGLEDVVRALPDYVWNLTHLIIREDLISACFTDSGTHPGEFLGVPEAGPWITITELSLYRVENGLWGQVWVAAVNISLSDQIRTS